MKARLWFYLPISSFFVLAVAITILVFFRQEEPEASRSGESLTRNSPAGSKESVSGAEETAAPGTAGYAALSEKIREHGEGLEMSRQLGSLSRLMRVSPMDAEERLSRLLEQHPNSPELLAFRADLYFSKGDFAEAVNAYRNLLRVNGDNGFAEARLAESLFRMGMMSDGQRALEEALERDPANIYALDVRLQRSIDVELGSATPEEERQKKEELVRSALAKDPQNPTILKFAAREALAKGSVAEAIQWGEKALAGNLHRISREEVLNILYEAALMSQDQTRVDHYAKLIQQMMEPESAPPAEAK